MPSRFGFLSAAALIMLSAVSFAVSPRAVAAQGSSLTRFYGMVTDVVGPQDNPTGFTLQIKDRVVVFRIAPHPTFNARSAEAGVEGFQVNDYAIVMARRVNRLYWMAYRVDYDVQPIRPPSVPPVVTVTGTVFRVTPTGRHFQLQAPDFSLRWIDITSKTKYLVDGVLQQGPPVLTKGDIVQVRMRPTRTGWQALEINLKLNSGQLAREAS